MLFKCLLTSNDTAVCEERRRLEEKVDIIQESIRTSRELASFAVNQNKLTDTGDWALCAAFCTGVLLA